MIFTTSDIIKRATKILVKRVSQESHITHQSEIQKTKQQIKEISEFVHKKAREDAKKDINKSEEEIFMEIVQFYYLDKQNPYYVILASKAILMAVLEFIDEYIHIFIGLQKKFKLQD